MTLSPASAPGLPSRTPFPNPSISGISSPLSAPSLPSKSLLAQPLSRLPHAPTQPSARNVVFISPPSAPNMGPPFSSHPLPVPRPHPVSASPRASSHPSLRPSVPCHAFPRFSLFLRTQAYPLTLAPAKFEPSSQTQTAVRPSSRVVARLSHLSDHSSFHHHPSLRLSFSPDGAVSSLPPFSPGPLSTTTMNRPRQPGSPPSPARLRLRLRLPLDYRRRCALARRARTSTPCPLFLPSPRAQRCASPPGGGVWLPFSHTGTDHLPACASFPKSASLDCLP